MVIEEDKITQYIHFQIERRIVSLYKNSLTLFEDLRKPPYNLSEEDYKIIRKKILDCSNDVLRETAEDFKKISIKLK